MTASQSGQVVAAADLERDRCDSLVTARGHSGVLGKGWRANRLWAQE
jgi:hypothetical protein